MSEGGTRSGGYKPADRQKLLEDKKKAKQVKKPVELPPQEGPNDSFRSATGSIDNDEQDRMVAFDVEDGTDEPTAQAKMGSIKTVFDPKDPDFFFLDLEAAMAFVGVKAQYTKQICLMSLLPSEVKRGLKGVIKASATNNGYKRLKEALLESHGPKPGGGLWKSC